MFLSQLRTGDGRLVLSRHAIRVVDYDQMLKARKDVSQGSTLMHTHVLRRVKGRALDLRTAPRGAGAPEHQALKQHTATCSRGPGPALPPGG